MRDRFVLTRKEQDQICDIVELLFKRNKGAIIEENKALNCFDLEIVQEDTKETEYIIRYDFENGNNSHIVRAVSLDNFDLTIQFEKKGDEYISKALAEKWENPKKKAPIGKQREILIDSMGFVPYILNAFIVVYNPKDITNIEERICKKSQWEDLKKKAKRENDGVRLFKCYTLKKDWKKAKHKKPHTIECKAWTVRGYYKTVGGKRIFVKPYVKGKERNNEEYLKKTLGKEYKLLPKK